MVNSHTDREIRILLLEDSLTDVELTVRELKNAGLKYTYKNVQTRSAFLEALESFHPDIILSDFRLPEYDGLEAIEDVQKRYPEIPVIVVTGAFSDVDAVKLISAGAKDYILKDRLARLPVAIEKTLLAATQVRARVSAEHSLRESEEKFRTLFEGSHDAIMVLNASAYIDCNARTLELLGLQNKEEFKSSKPGDFSPEFQPDGKKSSDALAQKIDEALKKNKISFEWMLRRTNGDLFQADVMLSAIQFGGDQIFEATVRDISERKLAEQRIHHLDRLLRSIRSINRLITHEKDQSTLLKTACNLLNEVGGYKMTWITIRENGNDVIRAKAGHDPECNYEEISRWDNAIWAEAVARNSCDIIFLKNCVRVLLIAENEVYGTMNICLNPGFIIDEEEQSLLREVAEDIAFALRTIELQKQREIAEKSLMQSEAGLAEAQRIAHLGNWNLDLKQNILTWSAEIYRIFEIDSEKFGASYEAFLDAIHPEDRDFVNSAYLDSLKSKKPYNITHRLKMKDGRIKYVKEQCETTYDNNGNPIKSVGTVHDITSQVLAEQALQESLTRYSIVTDSANDAIVCLRPDGRIHLWNKMAEKMFGYSSDEAIGKILHDLIVPPQYAERMKNALVQFKVTGKGEVIGKTMEMTALRRDKKEFPVELSISAMKIGNEWHATGIIRDISERKETEKERQEAAIKLENTLLQTIETIAATVEARDPYTAGHQRRVAVLASAIAREMGFPSDIIHGIYLTGTIHDLGKIHLPAEILNKPGKLKPVEFELIKTHSQVGFDIIRDVKFPWPIAQIILQHHERLDGSGYPLGLKADAILSEAKILAVADVVEAMSSHRPYRPSLGRDAALQEISTYRGTYYDPKAVDACNELFRKKGFSFE